MSPSDCIFCKIVEKEIPSDLVFENDQVLAFKDLQPQAPVHYLFIPKNHVNSLKEVDDPQTISNIFSAINEVAKKENFEGYRTVINVGPKGGQTVFHLHVHVLSGRQLNPGFS